MWTTVFQRARNATNVKAKDCNISHLESRGGESEVVVILLNNQATCLHKNTLVYSIKTVH
jgi:hypothetical protein